MKRGFQEALELARRRDRRAILAMRRAVRNDPTTEDAAAARRVLEEVGEPV